MSNSEQNSAELELLQKSILFNRLNAAQIKILHSRLKKASYKRNAVIFLKGDPGDALYILKQGRVKISVLSSEGKDLILNIYGVGEVFGEMSLFDGLPRSAAATALENTEVLILARPIFENLLTEVPQLAMNIIALLSRRLRYTTEQTEMLGLLGAYERVALKLLQLTQSSDAEAPLSINLSQQELAAMLGLTREWLNKVLKIFADQDIVELNWGKIILKNPEALKQWI